MESRRVTIPVSNSDETVSAVLTVPSERGRRIGAGIITAHGAGNDMENPLVATFSDGLARRGYSTLRFNFPYREKGLKRPDGQKKLEATWMSVYQYFRDEASPGTDHIIAAGKSLGGRVASQMVAREELPVSGLIFLGYPLHPPGDLSRLKDAHLYHISLPMLFFAGTRDSLCDMDALQAVLSRLPAPWKLDVIDGGDHSFHVARSRGIVEGEIFEQVVEASAGWIEATFASKGPSAQRR